MTRNINGRKSGEIVINNDGTAYLRLIKTQLEQVNIEMTKGANF